MTSPQLDIDRIVRDVLARLGQTPRAAGNGMPAATAPQTLMLQEQVVTLAQLEGRLAGLNELSLPRGAVLTPAARDQLSSHNVAISYRLASSNSASNGNARLLLAVAETNYDTLPLVELLARRHGAAVERISHTSLPSVTAELANQLGGGRTSGLLLTAQPSAALCLANRQRAIRAVGGENLDTARAAIAAASANLLVLDPAGKSYWLLAQMTAALLSAAGQACPDYLK